MEQKPKWQGVACQPIGVIHSPFREKFGIPRQPGLVPQARGVLELLPPYGVAEAVDGLDGYSHLWLQFLFHHNAGRPWQPTVRPPRLGGNRRVGLFASRSPFRPNPIGLSVVRLDAVRCAAGRVTLELSGLDLLDGTPVLDIKPYVPYVDSIPDARGGFAPQSPERRLRVGFSERARDQLRGRGDDGRLQALIEALLALDPRPAYHADRPPERVYGIRLEDVDVRWRVSGDRVEVIELAPGDG